ncbi:MAG: glycerol-3-phosphate dehydrogenase, partial [Armatimonadota bacterium]
AAADRVRAAFGCRSFRVYASDDVIGVEIAGALKNVVALGTGMAEGLGFGDNTKGALVARGLKETLSLGLAMGGRLETFLGIAGVGDLFATAASPLSRNNRVGRALGEGKSLADALAEVGQTAEGVPTAEAAVTLCRRHGVNAPVLTMIEAIIRGQLRARDGVAMLMERSTRDEGLGDLLRRE